MSKTGIKLTLVGQDGNAFNILGLAQKALRKAGQAELLSEFQKEAMSDDYDHLIRVCTDWFDVE